MVSLLFAHAVYTAAGRVYCADAGEVGGIPSDRKGRLFGRHPGHTVFAGDHQRFAPAGVCIQQRCAGRAGQLWLFPRHFLLLLPVLDGGLHDFFPYPPFKEKPRPQRQRKKNEAICDSLHNDFVRDFVSVGPAGYTLVARGYECDILPLICGDL